MWLVDLFECMMMHGLTNPKMVQYVLSGSLQVQFSIQYIVSYVSVLTLVFFFFFFFNRRYNPWWVLACITISFHSLLSLHLSLQFLTFIFFKSSSTWSCHLSFGLPTGLDEHGSHSVTFFNNSCCVHSDYMCCPS